MSDVDEKNDPVAELLAAEGSSATLERDDPTDANGRPVFAYERVVFTGEERDRFAAYLDERISSTLKEYIPIHQQMVEDLKTYDGVGAPGEIITITVAKADTNQQHAWLTNSLLSKKPYITATPLEAGEIQVLTQDPATGAASVAMASTEELAQDYEDLFQHKLTESIPWESIIDSLAMDVLTYRHASWLGYEYDPRVRRAKVPDFSMIGPDGAAEPGEKQPIEIRGWKEITVPDGDPHRLVHKSGFSVFMPVQETDPETSPIIFEKDEMDSLSLRQKFSSGFFDFCLPRAEKVAEDQIKELLASAENLEEDRPTGPLDAANRGLTVSPVDKHEVYRVYAYWPVKSISMDEYGQQVEQIDVLDICAYFHKGQRKLLKAVVNPYGERPYFPFFMQKRTHDFSGYSTVSNLAPYQKIISQIFHLQLQNKVMSNMNTFGVRSGSTSEEFFKNPDNKLKPGLVYPFDDESDIRSAPLGSPIGSTAEEIGYLGSIQEKLSVVTQYDRGFVPGRTAAASISQTQELAKMQSAMILRRVRWGLARAIKFLAKRYAQFSPYGEFIPFKDPAKKKRTAVLFPAEGIQNQFSFAVTATAEDESREAEFQRDMMIKQNITADNQELAAILPVLSSPQVIQGPPSIRGALVKLVQRDQRALRQIIKGGRQDSDRYVITDIEIERMVAELEQMAQMPPPQQNGAPSEQGMGQAGPGEAVPAGPGVDAAGDAPVPAEPGGGGAMSGPAPEEILALLSGAQG